MAELSHIDLENGTEKETLEIVDEKARKDIADINSNLSKLEEIEITKVTNTYADLTLGLCYAFVQNGVCHLQLVAQGLSSYSGWAQIASIPIKPNIGYKDLYAVGADCVANYNGTVRIAPDGKIYIQPIGNASSVYFANISFPYAEL